MKSTIAFVVLIFAVAQCLASVDDELKGLRPPRPLIAPRNAGPSGRAGGLYYYNTERAMTWAAADRYCGIFGQKLVQIDSLRTSIDIQGLLQYHGVLDKSFWSGGNNIEDIKVWRWDGGAVIGDGFTAWPVNQPDGSVDKRCLALEKLSLNWNQTNCLNENFVICQE